MSTSRDMISASLRLIGVLAPGESPEAGEARDGLATLNRMIGSWSNESLLVHSRVREEFALVAGTQSYTVGSGATFNTSRPVEIEHAAIEIQTSTPVVESPLTILTPTEWATLSSKELSSEVPTYLYAQGTYPNETVSLYPIPSAAHKLVLYSWKPLSSLSTLDTEVSLPPGYEEAIVFNLAIRLAPEYGRAVSGEVAQIAADSRGVIKRVNHRSSVLRVDNALLARRGGFNITTGEFS